MQLTSKHIRWIYELSFSIYAALLAVTEEEQKGQSVIMPKLEHPILWMYQFLAGVFHSATAFPGPQIHFFVLWFSAAVIIAICLCVLERSAVIARGLRYVFGCVAIAGFPLLWLKLRWFGGIPISVLKLLLFEVAVSVALLVVYVYRRWPARTSVSVALLAAHYALWSAGTWADHIVGDSRVYLLLGIFTSVVWGIHVRRCSSRFSGRPGATGVR
jgi:hypothetical protein